EDRGARGLKLVAPAKSGAHNHRRKLLARDVCQTIQLIGRSVWVPACAGTTAELLAPPSRISTVLTCPPSSAFSRHTKNSAESAGPCAAAPAHAPSSRRLVPRRRSA